MFYVAVYDYYHVDPIFSLRYKNFFNALDSYFRVTETRAHDPVNIMLYTQSGDIVYGF